MATRKSSRESPLVLAIDLGTSSVRTALFDEHAQRVRGTLAQRTHSLAVASDGKAELDPAAIERGLLACLESTLARARRPVVAVGVSCFWHSLIGTSRNGAPLTPIYTWADSRCREDAARLRKEISEREYHAGTGCMLRASFWPAKLRWLARTRPGVMRRVVRWQSPADWLRGKFCVDGADRTALGMATGTGLFDPVRLCWDGDLVRHFGLGDGHALPAIDDEFAPVRPEVARRFPALAGALWWPAIGDGAASNLGSGATRPGRAAINVGTSAAFRVMRAGRQARSPFGLFCYRVDADRYVVGGAVSNAGNLRAWCRRELRLPASEARLDRALARRPGPLPALVTLPFWSAERAPTWCEELGGTIFGLTHSITAYDLLQATTEAVYHRLAAIADASAPPAESKAKPALQIVVSGGILKSRGLLQRLADVLGRPVRPCREPEASLRGAAVFALEKMGVDPEVGSSFESLTEPAVRPRRALEKRYARERERQQRLETILATAAPL